MNVRIKSTVNRALEAANKMQMLAARWLTYDEQQLLNELEKLSNINMDAAVLHLLYTDYSFTPEQLNEFIDKLIAKNAQYAYDKDAYLSGIPEVETLNSLGVDVRARYEVDN